MTPLELLARLAALVPPPRFPLLRYAGAFAPNSPWRSAVVPHPPDATAACHHARANGEPADAPPAAAPSMPDSSLGRPSPSTSEGGDPLLAVPPPVPRTLSADHWRRLDDGRLLARQPRVDWATLLRRTWPDDVLCCPRRKGRMALIETVTTEHDIRRNLAELGLPYEPVSFVPPHDPDQPTSQDHRRRAVRGPPSADPPRAADPSPPDDRRDPPWQDDCQLLPEGPEPGRGLDDDASQVPPDVET